MYKLFICLISIFLIPNLISARKLNGVITDEEGNSLIGVTIFVDPINKGILSNKNGEFAIELAEGEYVLNIKYLGYASTKQTIVIRDQDVTLNISLEPKEFILDEVVVQSSDNVANRIMKSAIQMARVYEKSVKSYQADVYLKGGGQINKISKIADQLTKKELGFSLADLKNKYMLYESVNELNFNAPAKYVQRIQAVNTTIPAAILEGMEAPVVTTSLYSNATDELLSPLCSKAFSYYNFRLEGFIEDKGNTIYKIKVTPKVNAPNLYTGYLYIADDTWHIYSANLTYKDLGVEETMDVVYQQMGDKIYLPLTYELKSHMSMFGVDMDFKYYVSLTYNSVNQSDEKIVKELTTDKSRFNLDNIDNHIIHSDTTLIRDLKFWSSVRTQPLDSVEIHSITNKVEISSKDSLSRKKIDIPYSEMLSKVVYDYNFVDGWALGQRMDVTHSFKKSKKKITFKPNVYYLTARKTMNAWGSFDFLYSPLKGGKLTIDGGKRSIAYNPNGVDRLSNSLSSLFFAKNYNSIYSLKYLSVNHEIEIANGLKLLSAVGMDWRKGLDNHTDYTWGKKRKIRANLNTAPQFDRTYYQVGLRYAPSAYYRIKDGVKKYEKINSPVFTLMFSQALSSWQTNNSKYMRLDAGIAQNVKLSAFNNLLYSVEGGSFLGTKKNIAFADFKMFDVTNVAVNFKSVINSFVLLDNYKYATNNYWINGNVNYVSDYLLLKYLPFMQKSRIQESLSFRFLVTDQVKPYSEVGYSIYFTRFLNAGIYMSFDKLKQQHCGFRFAMDLR